MKRYLALLLAALLALATACSDDDNGPKPDGKTTDGPPVVGEGVMPWPDQTVLEDSTLWKCTPGEANMCNGYKTQYCDNGTCAHCPTDYYDCDRQGDCECYGACDGTKCVKGGG
jgi:hypothetical protein